MHVEIKSTNVGNPRPYKDEMYGEQQAALVAAGQDYPLPFKLNRKVSDPLKPGRYELDPAGFGTDAHGNLKLNKVRLIASAPAPAAASK